MAVCAGSAAFQGGITMAGEYMYIYPPDWGPMPQDECLYMLLSPQEFAEISSSSSELNAVMFPVALVVIFVLGWIAGAQR